MQSVMSHTFSQVPKAEIPRSSFDRSHGYKTTLNAGYLVPVFLDEALPGDTFNLDMSVFGRLATPLHPFMDNLFMDSFFFAVPYRLVWDHFQKFMGEQANPGDSTDYTVPQMTSPAGGYGIGTLHDYFGLPTVGQVGAGKTVTHNSLFHRAYNLIWNEWFRDENLQNSVVVDKDDGPDTYTDYVLLKRGKRHDYFTSCLPWPQKGAAVPLPLTGNAPVLPMATEHTTGVYANPVLSRDCGAGLHRTAYLYSHTGVLSWPTDGGPAAPVSDIPIYHSNLWADLSSVTAATVSSLRQAFQLQKLLERDARGGTRYTEIVRAHFGVVSPDARLQRPEYLGGGSTPINVNPIAQTSVTAATPQGNLAAMGTVKASGGHGFTKSFTEHCLIIGMVSVRADLNYQQGMNRMFSRRTKYDHFWPALAMIGEQAVLNQEIYCDGSANDSAVFGYQERYAEYRYKPSQITGLFRSTAASTLDVWHLAQKFTTLPTLAATFIQETPPIERVIAVTSEPHFLFDAYFRLKCARPMPVFGVPGLIDHF